MFAFNWFTSLWVRLSGFIIMIPELQIIFKDFFLLLNKTCFETSHLNPLSEPVLIRGHNLEVTT